MCRLLLHPCCILSAEHPLRWRIAEHFQSESLSLHSLSNALKLVALLGLLRRIDWSKHKMLLFAQSAASIALVETEILSPFLSELEYLCAGSNYFCGLGLNLCGAD